MQTELEHEFNEAMKNVYTKAKSEAGYTATRFMQILSQNGGLETAKMLLHSSAVSDGYTALWEKGRLDLTVEALVIDPKYLSLFTAEEQAIAYQRLQEYGYFDTVVTSTLD